MTKRTLILTDDDDPPWSGIRPPWPRIANPYKYLRAELARVVRHDREFANSDAVVCRCPVLDGSEPHAVTLRACARARTSASAFHVPSINRQKSSTRSSVGSRRRTEKESGPELLLAAGPDGD